MAGLLYVRTGNGGADGDFQIADLGVTISTGASWTLLTISGPKDPHGNSGQFNSTEIKQSKDLYDAVVGASLEWSKDGVALEIAGDYSSDYMLVQDLVDNDWDHTGGRLTVPNSTSLPASGRDGEFFHNTTEGQLYIRDDNQWLEINMGSRNNLLLDEMTVSGLTYVGEAIPGTATSAASWRIYRLDESGSGDEELIKLWANDSNLFDQIWDDRYYLPYILLV